MESVLEQCLSVVPGDAVLLEIMVKLLITVVIAQCTLWSEHSFLNSSMQNSNWMGYSFLRVSKSPLQF